jgi:hypothetical protein
MPIYGYASKVVDEEYGLLELREISLEFSPEGLRSVARFLDHYADRLESGKWRGGHIHLIEFDPDWRADHPGADVIIINPDPDPPLVVIDTGMPTL